jgi:hypothetical protein
MVVKFSPWNLHKEVARAFPMDRRRPQILDLWTMRQSKLRLMDEAVAKAQIDG